MTALLWACLTAGLYASIFPPFDARALSWIALVPLIRAVDGAGGLRSAALAGVFGFVTTVTITAWLVPTTLDYFERPLLVTLLFSAVVGATCIAPYFALCFGVLGRVQRALPRTVWLLLIPVAWVAAEYLRTQLGLRSSWGLLGVAQAESPRIRQLADLTGVYGVSALVALGNVCIAEALRLVWAVGLRKRFDRDRWSGALRVQQAGPGSLLAVTATFAMLLFLALDHGTRSIERVASASSGPGTSGLEVMLVQGNVDAEKRWRRGEFKHVLTHYGDLTRRALAREDTKPDLVIWPESAIQTSAEDPIYGPPLQRMVDGWGVPLIVGAPRRNSAGAYNSAFLLRPNAPPVHYDKNRLLPFSEAQPIDSLAALLAQPALGDTHIGRYRAGTAPGLFDVAGERLGILICFEAIYPGMARRVARQGSGVLVNLSNDGWYRGTGGPEQHLQHVIFRAVETGLPMLRATTTGITAVVSATGELVARAPEGEATVLRVRVPSARAEPTVYAIYGDVFAIGCGAMLVLALAASWMPRTSAAPRRSWAEGSRPG